MVRECSDLFDEGLDLVLRRGEGGGCADGVLKGLQCFVPCERGDQDVELHKKREMK